MTRTRTAAVTLTALLSLAACSSDDEPDTDPTPTSDETTTSAPTDDEEPGEPTPTKEEGEGDAEALEQAVRDYTDAYFAPDADAAYDMLSTRCQDSIGPEAYQAVIDRAADDYGHLTVETFAVDELAGDMARVTYTVGIPVFDDELAGQPWTREDGEWRYDAC